MNIIGNNPTLIGAYNNLIAGYNFTNGVPKDSLFVKLDPNIDDKRRNFLANGIRAYFKDDLTVLLDKKILLDSIGTSLTLF
jgi:ABC-type antimicrobial peptide transport system permease subunit